MATTMRLLRSFSSKFLEAREWKTKGLIVEVRSNHYIDSIAKVLGLKEAKYGQLVSIQSKVGLVVSLQKEFTYVLMFQDAKNEDEILLSSPDSEYIFTTHSQTDTANVSIQQLTRFLNQRPPLKHIGGRMWLNTGQVQIDVFTPLSYGQFCIFSGKNQSGKSLIAGNAISQFLKRGENHKVVIVSSNPYENVKKYERYLDNNPQNCFIYTPDTTFPQQYYMPYAALYTACKFRDEGNHVLLVIQDFIHHTYIKNSLFSSVHGVSFISEQQQFIKPSI